MDRRMFVKGAFGLVVLAACSGLSDTADHGTDGDAKAEGTLFTTPFAGEPETASGPLMMAGIDLLAAPGTDRVAAYYGGTEVFNVDASGAALVMLADGVHTIDNIADDATAQGFSVEPRDVALFFSSLGEAGYLRNIVRVSITE